MTTESYKSLKPYNTFGIDCRARYFTSVQSVSELREALQSPLHTDFFLLGGGSNILLTGDIDAHVVHLDLTGITEVSRNENAVVLEVMAGENWHEFVMHCIENDFGGIENLSLIPGNVGTAPIQNIGAYGVELKDVFISCKALDRSNLEEKEFTASECQFGYRDSIFKGTAKGRYVITSVQLQLTTENHSKNTSYGAIESWLQEHNIDDPSIRDISNAVIAIRQSKLPDPKVLGNSGSFFKNPVIDLNAFRKLKLNHPEAPYYEVSPTEVKIPAGWLIEHSGFKGKRFGEAGVHDRQALVLVNHGNASGSEIWNLAQEIQKKVKEDFDILIEPEVNVI